MKNLILTAAMFAATLANAEPSIKNVTYQTIGGKDAIVFEMENATRGTFLLAQNYSRMGGYIMSQRKDDDSLFLTIEDLGKLNDNIFWVNGYSDGKCFTRVHRLRDKGDYWDCLVTNKFFKLEVVTSPEANADAEEIASAVADANNNASTTRLGASYAYKYIDISGDGIPANAAKFRIWVINLASTYSLYVDLNLERNPQDVKNCRWYCLTETGYATYYEIVDANGQGLVGRWVYEGNITDDMTNAKGELTLIPAETRKAARCLKAWCEKNGPQPIGGFGSAVIVK